MSNCYKIQKICKNITEDELKPLEKQKPSAAELLYKLTSREITICPCCDNSRLHLQCNQECNNNGNGKFPPVNPAIIQIPFLANFYYGLIGEEESMFTYSISVLFCPYFQLYFQSYFESIHCISPNFQTQILMDWNRINSHRYSCNPWQFSTSTFIRHWHLSLI